MTFSPYLPPRQRELLERIAAFVRDGETPVLNEIVERMQLARISSLDNLLLPLEKKGLVTIQGGVRGRQRAIGLTPLGYAATQVGTPVLGQIPAGPIAEAMEEVEEWIKTPSELFSVQPGDFFLKVKGDSMIGDGIREGDRVLLRPNIQINNGEIAAVQISQDDGSYSGTLKHVFSRTNSKNLRLRASNPVYEDLIVPGEQVTILSLIHI